MNESKPKKMVSRTVAIALGIIAIVLLVGLVGAIADYTSIINGKNNDISTKDSQIQTLTNQNNQLKTWLDGNITTYNNYVNDHSYTNQESQNLQTTIAQLTIWLSGNITAYQNYVNDHSYTNGQYNSLQTQSTNLTNIANLADKTVWVNDQTVEEGNGAYYYFPTEHANYAGWITVYVQNSTVASTYVDVSYAAWGVSYSQEYVIGTGTWVEFPVLPANITIGIGNGLRLNWPSSGATETVTITCYY